MRVPFFCICLIGLATSFSQISAQTAAENDADTKRQLAALRDAVIQQTRQIDALTAEIERLGIALGQRRPSKPAAPVALAPANSGSPTVTTSTATPPPVAAPVATPTPDPNIVLHTVVKGEYLANIAKKYGTTAEAIQKLNKITDARKLQVGQVLSILATSPVPTPTAAPSPAISPAASPSPTPASH